MIALKSQARCITTDSIVFLNKKNLALHANWGRNDRNGRRLIDQWKTWFCHFGPSHGIDNTQAFDQISQVHRFIYFFRLDNI
jgi:hypothetical protein